MENKKSILRYSHIATLFLVALAIASAVWIYISLTDDSSTNKSSDLPKVEINQELYSKIQSELSFGTKVSADEPGFGRVNPFSNYKAKTVEVEANTETETTE